MRRLPKQDDKFRMWGDDLSETLFKVSLHVNGCMIERPPCYRRIATRLILYLIPCRRIFIAPPACLHNYGRGVINRNLGNAGHISRKPSHFCIMHDSKAHWHRNADFECASRRVHVEANRVCVSPFSQTEDILVRG